MLQQYLALLRTSWRWNIATLVAAVLSSELVGAVYPGLSSAPFVIQIVVGLAVTYFWWLWLGFTRSYLEWLRRSTHK
jgi:hypothetical protein